MKKNYKKLTKLNSAVVPATTSSKDWGFIPVSGKGGKTTNFEIPEWMFKRELEDLMGGAENA